jgi:hypothetical protein
MMMLQYASGVHGQHLLLLFPSEGACLKIVFGVEDGENGANLFNVLTCKVRV